MTDDTNGADEGRGALRKRLPPIAVPPDLERRVRSALESRGLVRHPHGDWGLGSGDRGVATGRRRRGWALLVGLLAAGFLLGLFARGALSTDAVPSGAAAPGQYVLLLYGDPPGDTGAVHIAREREYGRWASALTGGTRWVGGHELADVVESIGPTATAANGSTDRLAGYFVIEATSRQRATEVARSCPHLKYGGRVVVMAIAG